MRVWQPGKQSVMRGRHCKRARAWQHERHLCACVCVPVCVAVCACVCDDSTHMTRRLSGVGDVLIGYAWHDFCLEYVCLDMKCALAAQRRNPQRQLNKIFNW